MLKIMKVSNMEKFLAQIGQCEGEVRLHLPDGSTCDLKNDHTAVQLLTLLHSTDHEMEISLSNPHDYLPLMNYMMCEAA